MIGRPDEPNQTLNVDYVVCIWTGLALRCKEGSVNECTSVPQSFDSDLFLKQLNFTSINSQVSAPYFELSLQHCTICAFVFIY
jgi:hypothetical protein